MSKQSFGTTPEGKSVELFTLKSDQVEAQLISYGASIISLHAADRKGDRGDIVLGFPDLAGYIHNHRSKTPVFFGSVIGRYANRIANAAFYLDGKHCTLEKNDGENSLHGGPGGFFNVFWQAEPFPSGVAFQYLSEDGEEGYRGNLSVTVRYSLSGAELKIEYLASTDKTTVLNLTNHSYFNLAGAESGTILNHQLRLCSSYITPVDARLIPTGKREPVAGTSFDFRKAAKICDRIHSDDEQIRLGQGYDHNFVLDDQSANLKQAAELYEPASGRALEVWTTEPAIQFYSGNFLDGSVKGKNGVFYGQHAGLCLETQHFPDSPNHPEFPSTILRPGETCRSVTIFRFSAR